MRGQGSSGGLRADFSAWGSACGVLGVSAWGLCAIPVRGVCGGDHGVESVLPLPPPVLPQTSLGFTARGPLVSPRGAPRRAAPSGPARSPPPPGAAPSGSGRGAPASPPPLRPLPAPPGSVRPSRPSVPSGPVPPPPHGAPRAGVTEPHPRGSPPPRSRDGPRRLRGAISADLPRSADRGPPLRPRPGPEQLRAPPAPIAGAEPGPPPPPPTSGGTAGPFPRRGEGSSERPPVFGAGGELRWP